MRVDLSRDAVEEFVKGDKIRAFDVPMSLFRLIYQVDRVGETEDPSSPLMESLSAVPTRLSLPFVPVMVAI